MGGPIDRNCTGRRGKLPLDCDKLDKVKEYVSKMFSVQASQSDTQWKKCVIAMDEFLRRSNKGIIQRQREPVDNLGVVSLRLLSVINGTL